MLTRAECSRWGVFYFSLGRLWRPVLSQCIGKSPRELSIATRHQNKNCSSTIEFALGITRRAARCVSSGRGLPHVLALQRTASVLPLHLGANTIRRESPILCWHSSARRSPITSCNNSNYSPYPEEGATRTRQSKALHRLQRATYTISIISPPFMFRLKSDRSEKETFRLEFVKREKRKSKWMGVFSRRCSLCAFRDRPGMRLGRRSRSGTCVFP
jgi:hypothetical protein